MLVQVPRERYKAMFDFAGRVSFITYVEYVNYYWQKKLSFQKVKFLVYMQTYKHFYNRVLNIVNRLFVVFSSI